MKKILIFVSIAIVSISALFSSCDKQTDYKPSMAATIDSLSFSSTGSNFGTKIDTNVLTMSGTSNTFTPGTPVQPVIKINVSTAIGAHTIGKDASAMVITSATSSLGSPAISGTINVLNNAGGKVQGNFNFVAADGTRVTSGQFTTNP